MARHRFPTQNRRLPAACAPFQSLCRRNREGIPRPGSTKRPQPGRASGAMRPSRRSACHSRSSMSPPMRASERTSSSSAPAHTRSAVIRRRANPGNSRSAAYQRLAWIRSRVSPGVVSAAPSCDSAFCGREPGTVVATNAAPPSPTAARTRKSRREVNEVRTGGLSPENPGRLGRFHRPPDGGDARDASHHSWQAASPVSRLAR